MKKWRLLSALLICCIAVLSMPVSAAQAAVFQVGSMTGETGKTVEIPVSITANPGIAGAAFEIVYDESVLTLQSVQRGDVFGNGTFNANTEKHIVQWYDVESNANTTVTGVAFTLTFRVTGSGGNAAVEIRLLEGKASNLTDIDSQNVPVTFQAGNVAIREVAGAFAKVNSATGSNIQLSLSNEKDGICVVGVYDNQGKQLSTGMKTVPVKAGSVNVSLKGSTLPAHYTVKVFFVDTGYIPLCSPVVWAY